MELSVFLAKFWGLLTVIVTLALILKHTSFKEIVKDLNHSGLVLISAILSLMIGIPHILLHNIWTPDWRALVTILGWAAFLKGIMLLFFPRRALANAKYIASSGISQVILTLYLLLGLYLLIVGITV